MPLSVLGEASFTNPEDQVLLVVHVSDNKDVPVVGLTEANFRVSHHGPSFAIYSSEHIHVVELPDELDYWGLYYVVVHDTPSVYPGQTVFQVDVARTPKVIADAKRVAEMKDIMVAAPKRAQGGTTPEPKALSEDEGLVLIPLVHFDRTE